MPPSAAGGRSAGHDFGTMLDIKKVRMLPDGRSMVETQGIYSFRIMERGSIDGYMVGRIERCVLRPLTLTALSFNLVHLIYSSISYRVFDCPSLYPGAPSVPDDAPPIPPPVPPSVNLEANMLNAASVTTLPSTSSELGPPSPYGQEVRELVDVCLVFLDQVQRGGAPWVVQRLNRLNHIYGPMPTDPAYFSFWMAMVGAPPLDAHWRMHERSLIDMTAGSANRGDGKGQAFASQIPAAPSASGGSLDRAAEQQLVRPTTAPGGVCMRLTLTRSLGGSPTAVSFRDP